VFHALEVFAEGGVFAAAILEAFHIGGEFRGRMGGEGVDDPWAVAAGMDEAVLAEVGEVLGDFDLGGAEDVLEMADAKGPVGEEMKDAEAGLVAEAFVDLDEVHGGGYTYIGICVKRDVLVGECRAVLQGKGPKGH
jgi:hypothetical protein